MIHKPMISITNGGVAMAFGIMDLSIIQKPPTLSAMVSTVSFILILTCVATHSLVTSGKSIFSMQFSGSFGIGMVLYLIGVFVILTGILKKSNYSLQKDWTT
jgi:hypothetical protein